MARGDMPVLVGVGQALSQWDGTVGAAGAPSPLSLAADASKAALADAGLAGDAVDTVAFVRTFEDSTPSGHPHGKNDNLPGTLAREIGAAPRTVIYSAVGGQTPQQLVNEFAARIHDGDMEVALIAGSEANKASKAARKHGVEIDWTDSADIAFEDRGLGDMMLNRQEIKHGLVSPAYFYAFFENAIAAREGRSRSEHRAAMSRLWAKFAAVAETNPYSQFPEPKSAEFLATPSKANYPIADPFLKWHVAQDAVNQGAAVVMMSDAKADELGIAKDKRVYPHGGGEAGEGMLSERAVLDGSWAMETALNRALEKAGRDATDMAVFDLYSCFPCAVFSSTQALGIDPETETRPLTVTGGLPFFGGPGNNYSLHGIASMAERLRAAPGDFGLVLANGGWMTKEAAGVYSTRRPETFTATDPIAKEGPTVELMTQGNAGTLESFTVIHGRSGPAAGVAFIRTSDGARFIAKADDAALGRLREEQSPVGATVTSTHADEVNTFSFA